MHKPSFGQILLVTVAVAVAGCRKKSGGHSNSELDRAANAIMATEPPPATATGTGAEPAPAQQMKQAVDSYKSGQFEDAVTRLQNLRATPALSPQQLMALNDAMAAVMNDISAQAAKGDPRAIQALKQYEKMQTQRR